MHWLPLVAMVIASALPFPHNPVSSAAVTTTPPGSDQRRQRLGDPALRLAAPPASDYSLGGNASLTDYSAPAAASQNSKNLRNQKDYAKTSTFKLENQVTYQSRLHSGGHDKTGSLRTEDISEDNSLSKDYKANSRRQDYPKPVDFSKKDTPLKASAAPNHDFVSPATLLESQRGPEASERGRDAPTARAGAWSGPAEESLSMEAGQAVRMDSFLEDELFLDTHPRVLFSPSPSPPEHPPLLLMLESGLLEEDGEEQEDTDGHIEGHGDRAIDRSSAPSWADRSKAAGKEDVRPVRRDKRSHLMDKRRGEKSVCESENFWVVNKTTAIDSKGKRVSIVSDIPKQNGSIRQYFFETRCRRPEQQSQGTRTKGAVTRPRATGVGGGGCLGVDKKQWLSECKERQSYVRALTVDERGLKGWRWIRIDSSCVCVLLSRTNHGKGIMTKMGTG